MSFTKYPIPTHLHISSLEELDKLTGQSIWSVGQGGMFPLTKPHNYGEYFYRFQKRIITSRMDLTADAKDYNIIPNRYNNWYLCKSEENAWEIYNLLKTFMMLDPVLSR